MSGNFVVDHALQPADGRFTGDGPEPANFVVDRAWPDASDVVADGGGRVPTSSAFRPRGDGGRGRDPDAAPPPDPNGN